MMYEYRKKFRTVTAPKMGGGGMRDAARSEMEGHFDEAKGTFTRSFRVGPLGDCCKASASLAKGLSYQTHANASADVTLKRPWHKGRADASAKKMSFQRAHLSAYIRSVKESMEGTKGGSAKSDRWHTGYMPMAKRWLKYKASRAAKALPVIGCISLFRSLWKASRVYEDKATGHPKCETCGELQSDRAKCEDNPTLLQEVQDKQVCVCTLAILHARTHARISGRAHARTAASCNSYH